MGSRGIILLVDTRNVDVAITLNASNEKKTMVDNIFLCICFIIQPDTTTSSSPHTQKTQFTVFTSKLLGS